MKTALVTGAYGAIGKAIATSIASNLEYKLILLGRDPGNLKKTVEDVSRRSGNEKITGVSLDLSLKKNIEDFAKTRSGPLHVLVNNASTTPRQRLETDDGIEMQWAVNVLAYFNLMQTLTPHLAQAGDARIVNVASYWAGNLNLNDPEFKHHPYHNDTGYRQSKQAVRMLTRYFSELLKDKNISVNACHPGDVNSKLSNNLGYGGHETPEQGADTPVWLATSKELKGVSGRYFEHRHETYCGFMAETDNVMKLYGLCNSY